MVKSAFLLILALIFSCSPNDDDSWDDSNAYSHPDWILGTWELQETTPTSQYRSFVFSSENIIITFLDDGVLNFEVDQVNYSFIRADSSNYSFSFQEKSSEEVSTIDIIRISEVEFVLNIGNFDTYFKIE